MSSKSALAGPLAAGVAILSMLGAPACGGATAAQTPRVRAAQTRSASVDGVVTRVREGDPAFGVSALVVTSQIGSPDAPYWLAALAERRLRAQNHESVRASAFVGGYRVTVERSGSTEALRFVSDLGAALTLPVTEVEIEALAQARAKESGAQPALLTTPCTSETLPVRERIAAGELRAAQTQAHSRTRTHVAIVGPQDIDTRAREAWTRALPRGSSAPPPLAPSVEDLTVATAGLRSPHVAIVISDPDPSHAAMLSEAWSAPRSNLGARLRTRFEPRGVALGFGATGACVTLEGDFAPDDLAAGLTELMASTESAALSLPLADLPDNAIGFALSAPTSREAAERLVHAFAPTAKGSRIQATFRVEAPAEWIDGLADRVRVARSLYLRAAAEPAIEVRAHVEANQGELHLLLGSTCLATEETDIDAGQAAIWMHAASRAHVAAGVKLETWANGIDVGLYAHGPALHGETPPAHAERIARAMGDALAFADLPGAHAEIARSLATDDQAAFETLAIALAPVAPGRFMPFGTRRSVSRVPEVRTLYRRLGSVPLRLAAIVPSAPETATLAANTLAAYVPRTAIATSGTHACREPVVAAPNRGKHTHVRVGSDGEAYIAMPLAPASLGGADGARLVADVLAVGLERALGAHPSFATGELPRVLALGSNAAPVIAVRVSVPAGASSALEERVTVTEKAIATLSFDAAESVRLFTLERSRRLATQSGRLVALFREGEPSIAMPLPAPASSAADLAMRAQKAFAAIQADAPGRVQVLSRPRKP